MTAPCRSVAPLSPGWSKRQKDLPSAFWGPYTRAPASVSLLCNGEKDHNIPTPPPCGMPWEEVTGAVASSGQAGDKVLECLWQELLSLGVVVAADLLCISRQPVPVSTS